MNVKAHPDLSDLREMVLQMGARSEAILDKALQSVRDRDVELAGEVQRDDIEIDRLDVAIDEAVLRALALKSPVAEELRSVVAIKTMASDLERVGDLARNIAKSGMRLAQRAPTELIPWLEPLEREALGLLRLALDAFEAHDAPAARRVISGDDAVDALQDEMVRRVIQEISENPAFVPQGVDVIQIAKSLERVADHATNVAEDVIMIAEARNVKHAEKLRSAG
jgi:phosphate transport system protein